MLLKETNDYKYNKLGRFIKMYYTFIILSLPVFKFVGSKKNQIDKKIQYFYLKKLKSSSEVDLKLSKINNKLTLDKNCISSNQIIFIKSINSI